MAHGRSPPSFLNRRQMAGISELLGLHEGKRIIPPSIPRRLTLPRQVCCCAHGTAVFDDIFRLAFCTGPLRDFRQLKAVVVYRCRYSNAQQIGQVANGIVDSSPDRHDVDQDSVGSHPADYTGEKGPSLPQSRRDRARGVGEHATSSDVGFCAGTPGYPFGRCARAAGHCRRLGQHALLARRRRVSSRYPDAVQSWGSRDNRARM
jgi:hypothetical protein